MVIVVRQAKVPKKKSKFKKKITFQNLKCIFESRNPFIMANI